MSAPARALFQTVVRDPVVPLAAALPAGLLAGVLDILAAVLVSTSRGVGPARVLQGISSGLLGPRAFEGGTFTAGLGLALHFVVALGAATVFVVATRVLRMLVTAPYGSGATYGVAVWAFMKFVIIPISAVHPRPFDAPLEALLVAIHILCVGLPIALVVARQARREGVVGAR